MPSAWRRWAGRALDLVFTTANRRFETILAEARAPLEVAHSEPCEAGDFRIVILRRAVGAAGSSGGGTERVPP